jgi:hypothetical protein
MADHQVHLRDLTSVSVAVGDPDHRLGYGELVHAR